MHRFNHRENPFASARVSKFETRVPWRRCLMALRRLLSRNCNFFFSVSCVMIHLASSERYNLYKASTAICRWACRAPNFRMFFHVSTNSWLASNATLTRRQRFVEGGHRCSWGGANTMFACRKSMNKTFHSNMLHTTICKLPLTAQPKQGFEKWVCQRKQVCFDTQTFSGRGQDNLVLRSKQ
jgi:hypothetical protein